MFSRIDLINLYFKAKINRSCNIFNHIFPTIFGRFIFLFHFMIFSFLKSYSFIISHFYYFLKKSKNFIDVEELPLYF